MLKKILGVFLVIGILLTVASTCDAARINKRGIVNFGKKILVPARTTVQRVVGIGNHVTVRGTVIDDAVTINGNLVLKNGSYVGGNAIVVGGDLLKAPGAVVKGNISEISIPRIEIMTGLMSRGGLLRSTLLLVVLKLIGFLVLTILIAGLLTTQVEKLSASVDKHICKTFFVGLAAVFLAVPIAIFLALSVVGVAFIPLWVLLVGIAAIYGYVGAAHYIGQRVVKAFQTNGKNGKNGNGKQGKIRMTIIEAVVGVLLLCLVATLPVISLIINFVVVCWGLGAVILTKAGTQKA